MAISCPAFCRTLRQNAIVFLSKPNHHHPSPHSISPPTIPSGIRYFTFSSHLLRRVSPITPLVAPRGGPHPPRRPSNSKPAGAAVRSLFTGIVEEMGRVEHLGPTADGDGGDFALTVSASTVLGGVALGDSIAVNGACLTVTRFDARASTFTVGLSPETLRRTSLGDLRPGSPVNLERALRPDSRMGGHFVQGHVDGTGEITSVEPEGDSLWVKVRAPPGLLRYVVPKGFIAVDGTSLTVVRVDDEGGWFDFMLVAYTQQKVVIPLKKVGDRVNLEVDILGKYVERLLMGRSGEIAAAALSSSSS